MVAHEWEQAADELRALWTVPNLDAQTLQKVAPTVVRLVGYSDAEEALRNLEDLLSHYADDKHFGALLTALGLLRHHRIRKGTVEERLSDYGEFVLSPSVHDIRTLKEYAERGAQRFADSLLSPSSPFVLRPAVLVDVEPLTGGYRFRVTVTGFEEHEGMAFFVGGDQRYVLSPLGDEVVLTKGGWRLSCSVDVLQPHWHFDDRRSFHMSWIGRYQPQVIVNFRGVPSPPTLMSSGPSGITVELRTTS